MSLDFTAREAYDRARDETAFSNGSEWEYWSAGHCLRCVHDGMGLGLDDPQCPLIDVALNGRTPVEWTDQKPPLGAYECVYFRDRDDPGGYEPEPVPDPPGQLTLLGREPYTGVRMYADTLPAIRTPAAGQIRAAAGAGQTTGGGS